MSGNTARKYICQLEEQSLIVLEPTEIITKIGEKAQWKSFSSNNPLTPDPSLASIITGATSSVKAWDIK